MSISGFFPRQIICFVIAFEILNIKIFQLKLSVNFSHRQLNDDDRYIYIYNGADAFATAALVKKKKKQKWKRSIFSRNRCVAANLYSRRKMESCLAFVASLWPQPEIYDGILFAALCAYHQWTKSTTCNPYTRYYMDHWASQRKHENNPTCYVCTVHRIFGLVWFGSVCVSDISFWHLFTHQQQLNIITIIICMGRGRRV